MTVPSGADAPSAEPLADRLRGRGMRLTAQRRAVLEAVRALGHSTPEEVFTAVREDGSGLNITTVYRALDVLEEIGLVRHTHIGHGPPTYHAADNIDHVHVRCHACGGVESVPPGILDDVARQLAERNGFQLDATHVALSGVCADCAGKGVRAWPSADDLLQ